MSDDLRVEQLLSAIGREVRVAESPAEREGRRERVVGSMRQLHTRLSYEQRRSHALRRRLPWLLAAAVLTLASAALAHLRQGSGTERVLPELLREARENALRQKLAARRPAGAPADQDSAPETKPAPGPARVAAPEPQPSGTIPGLRAPATESQLGSVNQLFAEAKRARREHRDRDALAYLQKLLTQYPRSVLAHEASVERFRALSRLGRTDEARRYAALYLAQFPQGFAATEARRLAGETEAP